MSTEKRESYINLASNIVLLKDADTLFRTASPRRDCGCSKGILHYSQNGLSGPRGCIFAKSRRSIDPSLRKHFRRLTTPNQT